jgi:hypothetical protein
MLKSVTIFVASCFVIVGIFIASENTLSEHFQSCISKNATKDRAESSDNNSFIVGFIPTAKRQIVCSASLIDRHNGFFAAVASIVVAAFTVTLSFVTGRQAGLTKESVTLARDEFISTHRPRVIVRDVFTFGLAGGGPASVSFSIVNVGQTVATISNVEASVFTKDGNHRIPPHLPFTTCEVKKRRLQGGESQTLSKSSEWVSETANEWDFVAKRRILCIAGRIEYSDERGIMRQTGFIRAGVKIPEGFVFESVDDPDYEYTD